MALDGARLRPGVDCALDAGHGGVPCVVNVAGLELDLHYLSALFYERKCINFEGGIFFARRKGAYGVVDVGTDHETVTTAIVAVVNGNDVAGLFIVRCVHLCVHMGERVEV